MCSHVKTFQLPTASNLIFKEECTLCFDSQDSPEGINVCLDCFNGACHSHSLLHLRKTAHRIMLNLKRTKKEGVESRPLKMTKLSIQESPAEEFDFKTKVFCLECGDLGEDIIGKFGLAKNVDAMMNAVSAKKKDELEAWEEESVQSCYHTSELKQVGQKIEGRNLGHCKDCDLKDNLWLCLTCGNLGCGRAQYGGLGGNGHGLKHFESCKHPVAVKMGSITPEGTADVFCYEHGTEIIDPNLGAHLSTFGINIAAQEKTEKSIAELQLEQNLKFDFSMTTEDGKEMQPLYGPGYTGMVNLGNSCYMAAVLQTLFSIKAFQTKYFDLRQAHLDNCFEKPTDCFHCQMGKLADGLLSGKYSTEPGLPGVTPSMFKSLAGKGHPEFSTMRQQDAQEFLQYLISMVEQKERSSGSDPSSSCRFYTEHRLQCLECEKVQYQNVDTSGLILRIPAEPVGKADDGKIIYKSVDLDACIGSYFESDMREFQCPSDNRKTTASFTQTFATYPDMLFCVATRFILGQGWVMEKLNLDINAPLTLSLDKYRATGLQPHEIAFPKAEGASDDNKFDADALNQLIGMGFPENRCKKALMKTGNSGAETAMNWLFEHMEDPDIDDPIPSGSQTATYSDAELAPLIDMGFTKVQATIALKETGNNMERAVDWLFSHPDAGSGESQAATTNSATPIIDQKPANYELAALISHKGPSAHCGHYVAYIKKEKNWVLYNDSKVVLVPDITEPIHQAYLYVYRRIESSS